ncbi:protein of unknown function [Shewanella benthica]|uniref:Uncharacterized protein n=1 Tax=Shewanella benthica TaxID=43661 RepID=A0A330M3Y0_9GAMM|nr:protein of unknown function [Shewanella benthica]
MILDLKIGICMISRLAPVGPPALAEKCITTKLKAKQHANTLINFDIEPGIVHSFLNTWITIYP